MNKSLGMIRPLKCCTNCVKNATSNCVRGSKEANKCINNHYSNFQGKWDCKYKN